MTGGQKPFVVLPERVWRTYYGGKFLDQRQGKVTPVDSHYPEEWILSTVAASNDSGEIEGLCQVAGFGKAQTLSELLQAEPEFYLGAKQGHCFQGSLGVLTKIIDTNERLTIQVHPDRSKAQAYFDSLYGKLECWHILGTRSAESCIYLGFKPGISRTYWEQCFERQDILEMLNCLHRLEVAPGDTYVVPGGMPHAIGAGCLLLEIQEPTDFTLRTEVMTPSGQAISEQLIHQGIGLDRMFDCFDYTGLTKEQLLECCFLKAAAEPDVDGFVQLVGPPVVNCFRLGYQKVGQNLILQGHQQFYGLYVWAGSGRLTIPGGTVPLKPGSQLFIPAFCCPFTLTATEPLQLFRIQGEQL